MSDLSCEVAGRVTVVLGRRVVTVPDDGLVEVDVDGLVEVDTDGLVEVEPDGLVEVDDPVDGVLRTAAEDVFLSEAAVPVFLSDVAVVLVFLSDEVLLEVETEDFVLSLLACADASDWNATSIDTVNIAANSVLICLIIVSFYRLIDMISLRQNAEMIFIFPPEVLDITEFIALLKLCSNIICATHLVK